MNRETEKFVKQWLIKANEDLVVVEKLTEDEIIAAATVCFHCQQAVEKYLKAFLISNGIEIRKTHNIEFLLSECSELDTDFSTIDPKDLSEFGVDARYPGDMYIPSADETLDYKNIAHKIKEMVEGKIKPMVNTI